TDSHFRSPNGLDDRGYSSARDLVTLTRAAYEAGPRFERIVTTKYHDVPSSRGSPTRHIQNRDVLLWLYPGAIGVKTGYTTKAGYCLVAASHLNGQGLLAVVLGEPSGEDSFTDAATLMDYGFDAFVPCELIEAGRSSRQPHIN